MNDYFLTYYVIIRLLLIKSLWSFINYNYGKIIFENVNPQGHAWWHLLVSTGFYHLSILAEYYKLLESFMVHGKGTEGPEIHPVVEWRGGIWPVVRVKRRDEKKVK